MPTCFVIQPFDGGRFDKRFEDVFLPAIRNAGLEPYRVDRDPNVDVAINAIEDGIRAAAICFADITSDNPNVWYELGYAFALGKPVVMACGEERVGGRYPFDIQHRHVINYKSESLSDFAQLTAAITERLRARFDSATAIRQLAESEQVAPTQGLSQPELMVLAHLAGEATYPDSNASLWSVKNAAERSGLTPIGFSLAFRRLLSKGFVESVELFDNDHGEHYPGALLTDAGWDWIESNDALFVLKKSATDQGSDLDDDIPF